MKDTCEGIPTTTEKPDNWRQLNFIPLDALTDTQTHTHTHYSSSLLGESHNCREHSNSSHVCWIPINSKTDVLLLHL